MYTYLEMRTSGTFLVGFFSPDGAWKMESEWKIREEAVSRVHYLNGGDDDSEKIKAQERWINFEERLEHLEDGHEMGLVAERIHTGIERG